MDSFLAVFVNKKRADHNKIIPSLLLCSFGELETQTAARRSYWVELEKKVELEKVS